MGSFNQTGCVLQVHVADVYYLFDTMVSDPGAKEAVVGAVKQLMENPAVLKIAHDCAQLAVALRYQFSVELHGVFDTQVSCLTFLKFHRYCSLLLEGCTPGPCVFAVCSNLHCIDVQAMQGTICCKG